MWYPFNDDCRWSPRGVLLAATNDASFRVDSVHHSIPGAQLLSSAFESVPLEIKGFSFEGIANRNSLDYLDEYGLDQSLPTILRGTLRYRGFSNIIDSWKNMGLLSTEVMGTRLDRWDQLFEKISAETGRFITGVKRSSADEMALKTLKL